MTGDPALAPGAGFGLELIDEIDHVVKPSSAFSDLSWARSYGASYVPGNRRSLTADLTFVTGGCGASSYRDWHCVLEKENAMDRRNVLQATALATLGIGLSSAPQIATATEQASRGRDQMSNVNEIVVRYLAAWSEQDAKRRRELVANAWTEDGTYIDRVREGRGHDSIDAMIAKAQGHFPGYRLNLASGIEAHHDYVRFSWVAGGTADAPLYIKGTDFALIADDGRLKSVVGFIDAAPVPAAQQ